MRRLLLAAMITASWTPRILAQEASTQYPKIEGFAGYSGVITSSVLIPIGPGRNGGTDLDSSVGLETAVIQNLNRSLGLKADFSAHFGHYNEEDFLIPCDQPVCPTQSAVSQTRLFQFLAGPEIKLRNHTPVAVCARPPRWRPFQREFPHCGAGFELLRDRQARWLRRGGGRRFGHSDRRANQFPHFRGRRLGLWCEASEWRDDNTAPIPIFLGSTVPLGHASKGL
jgi:hypothetical protein